MACFVADKEFLDKVNRNSEYYKSFFTYPNITEDNYNFLKTTTEYSSSLLVGAVTFSLAKTFIKKDTITGITFSAITAITQQTIINPLLEDYITSFATILGQSFQELNNDELGD